jgi:hypothetical protein
MIANGLNFPNPHYPLRRSSLRHLESDCYIYKHNKYVGKRVWSQVGTSKITILTSG